MDKKKVTNEESATIAEHNYHLAFEGKKANFNNKGLSTTHEQAVDTWVEGTIEGEIDNINGRDEELRGK